MENTGVLQVLSEILSVQKQILEEIRLMNGDKAKKQSKPATDSPEKKKYVDEFEAFYALYPRKVGKFAAKKAYATARRECLDETILEGLQRYVKKVREDNTEMKMIPHPATWLNQGRWMDSHSDVVTVQPVRKVETAKDIDKREEMTEQRKMHQDEWTRKKIEEIGEQKYAECKLAAYKRWKVAIDMFPHRGHTFAEIIVREKYGYSYDGK